MINNLKIYRKIFPKKERMHKLKRIYMYTKLMICTKENNQVPSYETLGIFDVLLNLFLVLKNSYKIILLDKALNIYNLIIYSPLLVNEYFHMGIHI